MNRSSKYTVRMVVGCWLWLAWLAVAAEDHGYVSIAHACQPGQGPLRVTLDGKPMVTSGESAGWVSGRLFVAAGRHRLRFSRDGVLDGRLRLEVEPNRTTVLISHAVRSEGKGLAEPRWKMRVLKVGVPVERGVVTLVSVLNQPQVRVGIRDGRQPWSQHVLDPCGMVRLSVEQDRGYLPLRIGRRIMPSIPVARGWNDVVVLYPGVDGRVAAMALKVFVDP